LIRILRVPPPEATGPTDTGFAREGSSLNTGFSMEEYGMRLPSTGRGMTAYELPTGIPRKMTSDRTNALTASDFFMELLPDSY